MLSNRLYAASKSERERITNRISQELAGYPELAFAYLHGSFLDSPRFHDIDLGLHLSVFDPDSIPTIDLELASRLSLVLKIPVEVRILNDAPPTFLFHVLRGHPVASNDDELRTSVMETVMHRFFDLEPFLRNCTRDAFGP